MNDDKIIIELTVEHAKGLYHCMNSTDFSEFWDYSEISDFMEKLNSALVAIDIDADKL